jgi:hypothetical protein
MTGDGDPGRAAAAAIVGAGPARVPKSSPEIRGYPAPSCEHLDLKHVSDCCTGLRSPANPLGVD